MEGMGSLEWKNGAGYGRVVCASGGLFVRGFRHRVRMLCCTTTATAVEEIKRGVNRSQHQLVQVNMDPPGAL